MTAGEIPRANFWVEHYDAGVPATLAPYPETTLVDLVSGHARDRGHLTAIIFKGRHLSFREIDETSDALAQALHAEGVTRGTRVALLMPNVPQFILSELAVWKLGGIVVPLNPIHTDAELERTLEATAPEMIILLTPFYDRIKRLQPRTSIRRVVATNVKEYFPPLLRLAFTWTLEKREGHRVRIAADDLWFAEMVEVGSHLGKPVPAARPRDPAVILMSGGTTGTPKGVVYEHRAFVVSAMQIGTWLREAIAGEGASILLPLPLFHTYGCAGAQAITLTRGIPLILVPNARDIGDLLETIDRDRPTLLCSVPTLFMAMLSHHDVRRGRIDFRSIRACFSGAAPLMAETKRQFEELTGGRIVEGYSLTEASMACCVNPYRGESKIGSVGMPLPDVRVRIMDGEEATRELPRGEVGEIAISAPQLMRGYWNAPAETAQMLRTAPDGARWLFTGDLGYLDADGYLFIVDRKKDLIKTSGYQVWPREVEEVLATHPAVAEVGVAGVTDERKGEIVAAWVVPRDGMAIDAAGLKSFCRERLAPYKVPAMIQIRAELPKTTIGKVLRRTLVAEAKAARSAPRD